MSVRPSSDVSVAAWIGTAPDWDGWRLTSLGPPGFEAYARVPHAKGHGSDAENRIEGELEPTLLAALMEVLEPHTSTPQTCWFGLWDGWGDLHGGRSGLMSRAGHPLLGLLRRRRRLIDAPAFAQAFLDGPRVELPYRSFLLFTGAVTEAGDWDAADLRPGEPRRFARSPGLAWPSDRAWFVTTDVDETWTGVAGSRAAIDAVLADPRLDAVPVAPDAPLPEGA